MKPGKDCIGVGVGCFINTARGETLLMKRSQNAQNERGTWHRPGGTVEFGETALKAIEREVKEELGISIKNIMFLGYIDHLIPKENQHWLGLHFMAEIKSGKPKNMEPSKCDEIKWFKFDDVPTNLMMPTKESLSIMVERYKSLMD